MNTLVVCGTFDDFGGKASGVAEKLFKDKITENDKMINGGKFEEIENILNEVKHYEVVIWIPNIPNDKPKLRDIKTINPHCILVMSKRNDSKYGWSEVLNRALANKANLVIVFSKENDKFYMQDIDPLGYSWSEKTDDTNYFSELLFKRIQNLKNVKRQNTIQANIPNDNLEMIDKTFIELNRKYGIVFSGLLEETAKTDRFLGNCSFRTRCSHGFPSFFDRKNDKFFVSKRNIYKETLDETGFVEVYTKDNEIYYKGDNKPSVDTPIQLKLYEKYNQINYMIHSHCFINGAGVVFTDKQYPCGALNEIQELYEVISKNNLENNNLIKINLIGHGSLVMSDSIENLHDIDYVKREVPEIKDKILVLK